MNHITATDVTPDMTFYDVRNAPEIHQGQVENAINVPLIEVYKLALSGRLEEKFPKDKTFYVYCKSGARSMMACSILKKSGYASMVSVDGGYDAIRKDNNNLKFTK